MPRKKRNKKSLKKQPQPPARIDNQVNKNNLKVARKVEEITVEIKNFLDRIAKIDQNDTASLDIQVTHQLLNAYLEKINRHEQVKPPHERMRQFFEVGLIPFKDLSDHDKNYYVQLTLLKWYFAANHWDEETTYFDEIHALALSVRAKLYLRIEDIKALEKERVIICNKASKLYRNVLTKEEGEHLEKTTNEVIALLATKNAQLHGDLVFVNKMKLYAASEILQENTLSPTIMNKFLSAVTDLESDIYDDLESMLESDQDHENNLRVLHPDDGTFHFTLLNQSFQIDTTLGLALDKLHAQNPKEMNALPAKDLLFLKILQLNFGSNQATLDELRDYFFNAIKFKLIQGFLREATRLTIFLSRYLFRGNKFAEYYRVYDSYMDYNVPEAEDYINVFHFFGALFEYFKKIENNLFFIGYPENRIPFDTIRVKIISIATDHANYFYHVFSANQLDDKIQQKLQHFNHLVDFIRDPIFLPSKSAVDLLLIQSTIYNTILLLGSINNNDLNTVALVVQKLQDLHAFATKEKNIASHSILPWKLHSSFKLLEGKINHFAQHTEEDEKSRLEKRLSDINKSFERIAMKEISDPNPLQQSSMDDVNTVSDTAEIEATPAKMLLPDAWIVSFEAICNYASSMRFKLSELMFIYYSMKHKEIDIKSTNFTSAINDLFLHYTGYIEVFDQYLKMIQKSEADPETRSAAIIQLLYHQQHLFHLLSDYIFCLRRSINACFEGETIPTKENSLKLKLLIVENGCILQACQQFIKSAQSLILNMRQSDLFLVLEDKNEPIQDFQNLVETFYGLVATFYDLELTSLDKRKAHLENLGYYIDSWKLLSESDFQPPSIHHNKKDQFIKEFLNGLPSFHEAFEQINETFIAIKSLPAFKIGKQDDDARSKINKGDHAEKTKIPSYKAVLTQTAFSPKKAKGDRKLKLINNNQSPENNNAINAHCKK